MEATTSTGRREAKCVSIPIHGNQALKRGLAAHLIKLAGLEEGDLG
jgi:hypothetical protein